jgi:hypothetical protein
VTGPAPEFTSMDSFRAQWSWWPGSASAMVKLAESHGWLARPGFSRGYRQGQARDSYVLTDTIGVWVDGYGQRGVAFWRRDPDGSYTWTTDGTMVREHRALGWWTHLSHTDFTAWLESETELSAELKHRYLLRAEPLHTVPLPPIQGCALPPAMVPVKVSRKNTEAS